MLRDHGRARVDIQLRLEKTQRSSWSLSRTSAGQRALKVGGTEVGKHCGGGENSGIEV